MEDNKKKEPKLRVIKAPQSVEPFVNSTANTGYSYSGSGGWGTDSDDCMSQELFIKLNDLGILKSSVYVCGWGWTFPDTVIYGSSGSGSSGSSGWDGSSGSSSSSSSGSSGSSSSSSSSGTSLNDGDKEEIRKIILGKLRGMGIDVDKYSIHIQKGGEVVCTANAITLNGEIWLCKNFFMYDINDQASIVWHELYHLMHNHSGTNSSTIVLDKQLVLNPDEELKRCLQELLEWKFGEVTIPSMLMDGELKHDKIHAAQWYQNEVDTYTAELANGIPKSDMYLCETKWNLWKCQQLLEKAKELSIV